MNQLSHDANWEPSGKCQLNGCDGTSFDYDSGEVPGQGVWFCTRCYGAQLPPDVCITKEQDHNTKCLVCGNVENNILHDRVLNPARYPHQFLPACSSCDGSGADVDAEPIQTGAHSVSWVGSISKCSNCNGTGRKFAIVSVPASAERDKTLLEVREHVGNQCDRAKGEAFDALWRVCDWLDEQIGSGTEPHQRSERVSGQER